MKQFFSITTLLFCFVSLWGQSNAFYTAKVLNENNQPIPQVAVVANNQEITQTNKKGYFSLSEQQVRKLKTVLLFSPQYKTKKIVLPTDFNKKTSEVIVLEPLEYELSEVAISTDNWQSKNYRTLREVEGTTINTGRKNEVVLLKDMSINKVTNNARQIFSKVVGVTINESSEGGLQLNIGGRGLNPNRTANFNTRQNDYDISADVLGYPESYYTPPAEAVREIQVVRGASSLQYGTQFGGMVNFKMNRPAEEPFTITQRTSYGSHKLISSFTEVGGTVGKFGYYTYFNYKKGDGFRPNSNFTSKNAFVNLVYKINDRTSLSFDWLKYYYVAKQPGGLTNKMFYDDPLQSNRSRNWFKVDWNVINLKLLHHFNEQQRLSFQCFGLMAERTALGYRSFRVSQPDKEDAPRDLLVGKFANWGFEGRYVNDYNIFGGKHTLLGGVKYYHSRNSSQQGAGSASASADFNFAEKDFPYYERQSKFIYPNRNIAIFAENIFHIGKNTAITPGFRAERIKTQSDGHYRVIAKMDETILNDTTIFDNVVKDRYVFLAGISLSHKTRLWEFYGNLSQNYRSVTFSDIHSHTPGFAISPTITDEKGFSSDLGMRGRLGKVLYFDCSLYALYYGNKIGEYLHENKTSGAVERYRDNVGTAFTYGFESLLNWDISRTFFQNKDLSWNYFINTAFTGSSYLTSQVPNVEGNDVEFVPLINLKSGLELGYKGLSVSTQLTYVSSQYADATNQETADNENLYGIFGKIPAYYVMDLSVGYRLNKHIKMETTLQNLTNNYYFTQRATGYPGPGIIPSMPFNFVGTLEVSF